MGFGQDYHENEYVDELHNKIKGLELEIKFQKTVTEFQKKVLAERHEERKKAWELITQTQEENKKLQEINKILEKRIKELELSLVSFISYE